MFLWWHIITRNYFDFQFGIRKMFFHLIRQRNSMSDKSCLSFSLSSSFHPKKSRGGKKINSIFFQFWRVLFLRLWIPRLAMKASHRIDKTKPRVNAIFSPNLLLRIMITNWSAVERVFRRKHVYLSLFSILACYESDKLIWLKRTVIGIGFHSLWKSNSNEGLGAALEVRIALTAWGRSQNSSLE